MSKTNSLFSDLLDNLDEKLKWHQLPKFLGLVGLLKFRNIYREKNLFDTEDPPFSEKPQPRSCTAREGEVPRL